MSVRANGSTLEIVGPVTLDTLCAIRAAADSHLSQGDWTVDWRGVSEVDSVALSLMFAWERAAHAAGRTLHHVNLPSNLTSLAQLYGVSELIPA